MTALVWHRRPRLCFFPQPGRLGHIFNGLPSLAGRRLCGNAIDLGVGGGLQSSVCIFRCGAFGRQAPGRVVLL